MDELKGQALSSGHVITECVSTVMIYTMNYDYTPVRWSPSCLQALKCPKSQSQGNKGVKKKKKS